MPFARDRRRDERERQLIGAALACISERGLSDTTVQSVAAAAGMAAGSISQYFDSKAGLLQAVLESLASEFESHWRSALEASGDDPAERLATFVASYFSASLCQRRKIAVWFAFWGEAKAVPQYQAVCAGYDATHDAALEALCADLIAAGAYEEHEARDTAALVASMCHGLWLEFLTGRERRRRSDLARLAHAALTALFPRHREALGRPLLEKSEL